MSDTSLRDARAAMAVARDGAELAGAAAAARLRVRAAVSDRVSAAALAAEWSALCAAAVAAAVRCVGDGGHWYVSGSVGRGEALPGADLETLVCSAPDTTADDALAGAAAVHQLLADCGFTEDPHGAFAARGRFNRSAADWSAGIAKWAARPEADRGVVMTGLLSDAVAVTGGPDLRAEAAAAAREQPAALSAMLEDATAVRAQVPPRLRIFGGGGAVDVKRAIIDPVVRIGRWAALSVGADALSTPDRLAAAAGSAYLDDHDAALLTRSHRIGVAIRWRLRAEVFDSPGPPPDTAEMSALTPADRTALRHIGREVNGVCRKLRYLASTSAFSRW
ncbi:putative nucleotidyltransferase substrate binding domain-containing protein [Mycolicibacterium brumae]|nr:putative nucleotidyltransferase substrate binding domain-containing protein [Mycolicibacterium brumae]MCV7192972.1 hypothetical protein [Mycolicibacterium brumae]RWA23561.1 hypothetical protein MBRU_01670 [Mycolicibacterium brumae DSM 44177]UWW08510.1 DUF294 nucleotidyltransferase-like domain-containing protein [Mycolicibacterium brumae]